MAAQAQRKRFIFVELFAWMLLGGTVLVAGLMMLGYTAFAIEGEQQIGLPFEVLVVLAGGIAAGIGLLRSQAWAWFLVGLGALVVATTTLVAALRAQLVGIETLFNPRAGVPWGLTEVWIGAGVISAVAVGIYLCFQLRPVRQSFPLSRPAWQPIALQVLVAAVLAAMMIVPHLGALSASVGGGRAMELRQIGEARGNTDEDLALLLEGLADGDIEERVTAAWALGLTGRPEAIEPLLEVADGDDSSDVRINAIDALVALNPPDLGQALGRWAGDPDIQVRNAALRGLADPRHADAADSVAALLAQPDADLQALVIDVLGRMGNPSVIPQLARLVDSAETDVRSRAAFAMGKLKHQDAVEPLTRMLGDESWEVRANAAQALGMIGSAGAVPVLEQHREDPNSMVRDAVAAAIARIDGS